MTATETPPTNRLPEPSCAPAQNGRLELLNPDAAIESAPPGPSDFDRLQVAEREITNLRVRAKRVRESGEHVWELYQIAEESKAAAAADKKAWEHAQKEHFLLLNRKEPLFDYAEKKTTATPSTNGTHTAEPAKEDESWKAVGLDTLGLSAATVTKLEAADIVTVGHLQAHVEKIGQMGFTDPIAQIKGIGAKTAEKIDAALQKFWTDWRAKAPTVADVVQEVAEATKTPEGEGADTVGSHDDSWRSAELNEWTDLSQQVLSSLIDHNPPIKTVGDLRAFLETAGVAGLTSIKGIGRAAEKAVLDANEAFDEKWHNAQTKPLPADLEAAPTDALAVVAAALAWEDAKLSEWSDLSQEILEKLANHKPPMTTFGELRDYLAVEGNWISKVKGIGKAAEKLVFAANEAFDERWNAAQPTDATKIPAFNPGADEEEPG